MSRNGHRLGSRSRPKVGLVLGAGGARGYAHLGVMQALQQHSIPIDLVVGTSMGAVMGSALACDLDLHKLEKVLCQLDLNDLLNIPTGAFQTAKDLARRTIHDFVARWKGHSFPYPELQSRMRKMCEFFFLLTKGMEFSDLAIPFAAVATDIETGEQVVIRDGEVCKAMEVSAATPDLYYPLRHQGRWLIDGGVVNYLPIDVAIDMGADRVIAVNVDTPLSDKVDTSFELLARVAHITVKELIKVKQKMARERLGNDRLIVLEPDVAEINKSAFERVGDIINAGKVEVERQMRQIQDMIYNLSDTEVMT
ncbi:MAG: patatin-like phospholipase family protein [Candidatus Bipolaricaulia bacterium]